MNFNENEIIQDYWDKYSSNQHAHLTEDFNYETLKGKKIIERLKSICLDLVDWKDKIVIDYGIGASLVGQYLFKEAGLKKYIGYDLSNKSIKKSKDMLQAYLNKEYFLVVNQDYNFKKWSADVLISLACIQHFPSEGYLIKFLEEANTSDITTIVLQIRYSMENYFHSVFYSSTDSIIRACYTNFDFIKGYLPDYEITYLSKVYKKSNYQYGILKRN